jgi:O-antigen ligase
MSEDASSLLPARVPPVFIALAAGALFLSYPLALLPYGALPLQHHLSVDSTLLLVLISVAVIAGMRVAPPRWLTAAVAVFCLSVIVAAIRGDSGLDDTLRFLGTALIPLAAAVVYHERLAGGERLVFVLAVLWLMQILLGLGAIVVGMEVVGLTGNRNWMASFVLGLAPWAWLYVWRRAGSRSTQTAWVACLVAVVMPTLLILHRCESRGAWLALIVCCLLAAWSRLGAIGRTAAVVGMFVVVMLTVVWAPVKVAMTVQQDVRPPLWTSSARMISDRPLGIGPGSFTREFAPYRVRSTYPFRLYAAAITLHPHNELLYQAAVGGIVAGIAWLMFILPVFRRGDDEPPHLLCARVTAVVLVTHGMFDMVLVQAPGNILALLALGICWSPLLRELEGPITPRIQQLRRTGVSLAALATVLYGTAALSKDLQIDRLHRRGYIEEVVNGNYQTALSCYVQAGELAPRDPQWPLYAGSIGVDWLQDPDLALPHLLRGYKIDPRYGHINRQLGRAHGMRGEHEIAMQYFDREVQLYPASAAAHRDLLSALVFVGAVSKLDVLDARIQALTRSAILTRLEPRAVVSKLAGREVLIPAVRGVAESWTAAVKAADVRAAHDAAARLLPAANSSAADPLFYLATEGQAWPQEIVKGEFNEDDFAYWQERLFFAALARSIVDRPNLADAIAEAVSKRIVAIVDEPSYTTPFRTWNERRGNTLSVGHVITVVADNFDLVTVIHRADRDELVCTLLSDTAAHTVTMRADRSYEVTPVGTIPPQGRICFYPDEFFWRNLSLGTALGLALPDERMSFNHVPILRVMQYLRRCDRRLGSIADLRNYVETAPLTQRFDDIKARRSADQDSADGAGVTGSTDASDTQKQR